MRLDAIAFERGNCGTGKGPTPKPACLHGRPTMLSSATFVAMMQTPDLREREDFADGG
jgi:hypothetical protein